jgi:hypothetical protein
LENLIAAGAESDVRAFRSHGQGNGSADSLT